MILPLEIGMLGLARSRGPVEMKLLNSSLPLAIWTSVVEASVASQQSGYEAFGKVDFPDGLTFTVIFQSFRRETRNVSGISASSMTRASRFFK